MKTKNKIDPSHIWDIRDERLDSTSKSLLIRIAGLQHLNSIWVSNGTLAQDLNVSKRTIIEKMKILVEAEYVFERTQLNVATQTKVTELNESYIIDQILTAAKGQRKSDLEKYYSVRRENKNKKPLLDKKSKAAQTENKFEDMLNELEKHILN